MQDPDNVAGYKDILTGSHDAPAQGDGAAQIAGSSAPELKSLLGIAVGTLVIAALYFGKEVLIPITLAVMLSFVLSPVVNLLQRLRLWRAPGGHPDGAGGLGALGLRRNAHRQPGGGAVRQCAAICPDDRGQKVQGVQGFAVAKLAAVTQAARRRAAYPLPARAEGQSPPTLDDAASYRRAEPEAAGAGRGGAGGRPRRSRSREPVLAPILSPLETTILVLIVAIFVLMQKEDLRDRFIRLFGSNDLHRTTRAMDDAGKRLSKYFLSQLGVEHRLRHHHRAGIVGDRHPLAGDVGASSPGCCGSCPISARSWRRWRPMALGAASRSGLGR